MDNPAVAALVAERDALRAAKDLGRNAIGIELREEFVEMAMAMLVGPDCVSEALTGKAWFLPRAVREWIAEFDATGEGEPFSFEIDFA